MGAFSWKLGLAYMVLAGWLLLACNPASTATGPGTPGQGTTAGPTMVTGTVAASPEPTATRAAPTAIPTPTIPTTVPTPAPTVTPSGPVVTIGSAQFTVAVATTPQERSRGLSGRANLAPGTGMLFVFEGPGTHQFWMNGMHFPLDFVWISDDCAVVDLTQDVPPPQPGQEPGDLPRYRPSAPVRYVLEINAGVVEFSGIQMGDSVMFGGELSGAYGC